MRTIAVAMAALAVMAAASAGAAAPLQVALVEDVSASSAGGVMLMDYVETGKVIALGPDDTLVLSYMTSCIQETIRGGTVTVGTTQSEVRSGKVKRVHYELSLLVRGERHPVGIRQIATPAALF